VLGVSDLCDEFVVVVSECVADVCDEFVVVLECGEFVSDMIDI
jgi:hypothetical protein